MLHYYNATLALTLYIFGIKFILYSKGLNFLSVSWNIHLKPL